MRAHPTEAADVVASALVAALMEARWEVASLLSRHAPAEAAERLRGHAAELAMTPLGCDQVLSLALDAAAEDLENDRPPLREGVVSFFPPEAPNPDVLELRSSVYAHGGAPAGNSGAVVAELVARRRLEARTDVGLAHRLTADARLHERLWDDRRIPASPQVRWAMLCSVPKLRERAADLHRKRVRARRRAVALRPTPAAAWLNRAVRQWRAKAVNLWAGPIVAAVLLGAAGLLFAVNP